MVLELVFWDVQHGSSTYIKTPNGRHIVHDLGLGSYKENSSDFSPLNHLQNKYGVSQLDYVIITHPHKDHIEDILNFDNFSPKVLLRPKNIPKEDIVRNVQEKDKAIFNKYFDINKRYSNPVTSQNDPEIPSNYGGIEIKNFYPNSCSSSNINNSSIVTVLSYASSKVVLTGDNESCAWNELLKNDTFKNAIKDTDIFLAPHHGRKSGFHAELFEHFRPKLTIISDSKSINTSDTNSYTNVSDGWAVFHRNGNKETRYCLTTRKDGVIVVRIGKNAKGPFLNVKID